MSDPKIIDDVQFQRIARALADPHRREILECIVRAAKEGVSCGAVVEKMPLAQATVSHHLKELVEAGLLSTHTERQFHYYTPRPETIDAYAEELRRRLSDPASRK